MKLVTFEAKRKTRIGALIDDEKIIDIVSACQIYRSETGSTAGLPRSSDMIQFLNLGDEGISTAKRVVNFVKRKISSGQLTDSEMLTVLYDKNNVKLKAPILNPRKIICLGLNYADHAKEAGLDPPKEPILFSKPPTAIIGPEEPIIYPKISNRIDYEVELAVIIGKKGKDIPIEETYSHIAGYTVFDDVSARDIQFQDGQWYRGKSFDTFAPIGPCLVLKEQIPDPHDLRLGLRVNGEIRQNSSTRHMIFKVPFIVSFVSEVMTLEPGDVIATGTPAGVGIYAKPEPKLLKPGDVVEAWIEKIGTLRNTIMKSR